MPFLRVVRVVLCGWVAALLPAQVDFVELPWRVGDDGRLEYRPLANGNGALALQHGDWRPMFGNLLAPAAGARALDVGLTLWPFSALPLLLHGDGGAAAIDEATLRLRKLGLGTTVHRETLYGVGPDPLLDLLRVRHLATTDVATAGFALQDYASDARRDRFVRAAAAQAWAAGAAAAGWPDPNSFAAQRPARNGAAALHGALARMPDDVDLVLGLHSAALPGPGALLAAWRTAQLRLASSVALHFAGSLPPAEYTKGQLAMDHPGQLPFELAARLGNWRVDHALLALRAGEPTRWWFQLGGAFQRQRIAAGLGAAGGDVRLADNVLRATIAGWEVRATATELEAWSVEWPIDARGGSAATLHDRAGNAQAPVWAWLPASSALGRVLDAAGATIDVRLSIEPRALTATARCPDAAGAERLLAGWRAWQAARTCELDDPIPEEREVDAPPGGGPGFKWRDAHEAPPGVGAHYQARLVWRRCVQAVRATPDGTTVRWELDLAPFSLLELVPLLGEAPLAMLERG